MESREICLYPSKPRGGGFWRRGLRVGVAVVLPFSFGISEGQHHSSSGSAGTSHPIGTPSPSHPTGGNSNPASQSNGTSQSYNLMVPLDEMGNVDYKALNALNQLRKKQITEYADKLIVLARELNDEVGTAPRGALSAAQFQKAEKIEKLARGVQVKMKATNQN